MHATYEGACKCVAEGYASSFCIQVGDSTGTVLEGEELNGYFKLTKYRVETSAYLVDMPGTLFISCLQIDPLSLNRYRMNLMFFLEIKIMFE